MYGGSAGTLFNDVRAWDADSGFWSISLKDKKRNTLPHRFGCAVGGIGSFMIAFGGNGERQATATARSSFNDVAVFNIDSGEFCKFEGNFAALASQINQDEEISKH
jgi:hypothetical protein